MTLLTTNKLPEMYQQIVKETTAKVLIGADVPNKALAETVYKWRKQGLTVLRDKSGREWNLGTYAKTVIDNSTYRSFQQLRDTAAEDNDIDTFVMSSHTASRPACAHIQGGLVTTRRKSFTVKGERFESLYNHDYGKPSGTFGINCHHMKWIYIPGVNTNNQPQFAPEEAMENHKIEQKQRALERKVRENKQLQSIAEKLGDEEGATAYKNNVRKYQSALRKHVSDHDFLHREYDREKIYSLDDRAAKRYTQKSELASRVGIIANKYRVDNSVEENTEADDLDKKAFDFLSVTDDNVDYKDRVNETIRRVKSTVDDFKQKSGIDVIESWVNGSFIDVDNPYNDDKAKFVEYLLERTGQSTRLPKKLSSVEGKIPVFRGVVDYADGSVTGEEQVNEFLNGKLSLSGALSSAIGRGLYMSTFRGSIDKYLAKGTGGKMIKAYMDEDARLLGSGFSMGERSRFASMKDEFGEDAKFYEMILSKTKYDNNCDLLAIFSGYDGMERGAYKVIYDRGKLGVIDD
ncbi:MAG: phage minor capsid protein [Enterococcus sp.]